MPAENDDQPILDAALELFGEIGIDRTTVGDIADRAKVNRVTVYRRHGSKIDVLQKVMAREADRLFVRVSEAASGLLSPQDRIAHAFAATVVLVRSNPILRAMFVSGESAVLEELTVHGSRFLERAIVVADAIARPTGSANDRYVIPEATEVVVRVVHSILLTPHARVPLDTTDDLVAFGYRNVVPILTATTPSPVATASAAMPESENAVENG
ncbi:TetR/AcrR family transcriptional regulator [Rhodococcus sp. NBC_00297]|uniref:TetR/AcrR family transcriptional regulator n=1 Tax=Rhodococcus sp. NBC_00297 TaxID=2976005 RepID=UPI002E27CAA1|nr:helix-turn-helix domain-containing protein [Rhodococcus sp. NBC_00297]